MKKLSNWFDALFNPLKGVPEEAFATREELEEMFAAEESEEWGDDSGVV